MSEIPDDIKRVAERVCYGLSPDNEPDTLLDVEAIARAIMAERARCLHHIAATAHKDNAPTWASIAIASGQ